MGRTALAKKSGVLGGVMELGIMIERGNSEQSSVHNDGRGRAGAKNTGAGCNGTKGGEALSQQTRAHQII